MHEINIDNLRLQDFKIFMTAARYGSFTKAGEKLFLTQSWVSKRVSALEEELGLQLFLRNGRSLQLTPAGKVLASRYEKIDQDLLDSIAAAHQAQNGTAGTLRIGFLEWGTSFLIPVLETYMRENPHISVDLFCQQFAELRSALESDRVDLILTMEYDNASFLQPDICINFLRKVPVYAYMSRKNPLSEKKNITIEDMKSENMLMLENSASRGYVEYVTGLFHKRRIRPLITQYARSGREHMANLLLNRGILIASGYFLGDGYRDQIAAVPIENFSTHVTAVWKRQNQNSLIDGFLKYLRE